MAFSNEPGSVDSGYWSRVTEVTRQVGIPVEQARRDLVAEYRKTLETAMRPTTREIMTGALWAFEDNPLYEPARSRAAEFGLSTSKRHGYKVGQLTLIGHAALRLEGDNVDEGQWSVLSRAPDRYLRAIRGMSGNRRELPVLVMLHEEACAQVEATMTQLASTAELAFFRWLVDEWGVLPLEEAAIPCWLRVLVGLPDLEGDLADQLHTLRDERSLPR